MTIRREPHSTWQQLFLVSKLLFTVLVLIILSFYSLSFSYIPNLSPFLFHNKSNFFPFLSHFSNSTLLSHLLMQLGGMLPLCICTREVYFYCAFWNTSKNTHVDSTISKNRSVNIPLSVLFYQRRMVQRWRLNCLQLRICDAITLVYSNVHMSQLGMQIDNFWLDGENLLLPA